VVHKSNYSVLKVKYVRLSTSAADKGVNQETNLFLCCCRQ